MTVAPGNAARLAEAGLAPLLTASFLPESGKSQFHNLNFIHMSALGDKIRGNWNQLKGKLKEKYGQLTDDDLAYQEGKEDQLIGRLQEKLGMAKEDVKKMINNL